MTDAAARGQPLADLVAESERVLAAAKQANVMVRLAGGLAIRRLCPAATRPPLERPYADLDLAVTSDGISRKSLTELMTGLGYAPDDMFNTLNSKTRLYFRETRSNRHVDVFVDAVRMCHVIDFRRRIGLAEETLTSTDLLLTKLQIVELNKKDLLDVVALLHDQVLERESPSAIDMAYLEEVWADDWPLWKTCQLTLAKVRQAVPDLMPDAETGRVLEAVGVLEAIVESGRKNLRWRLRARVGERVRWYEIPEEVD